MDLDSICLVFMLNCIPGGDTNYYGFDQVILILSDGTVFRKLDECFASI